MHQGHRERLRNKYIRFGREALEEHELLELLLFYAIPQKNTNPIAHALLDHFGSLKNVFDADISALCAVDGIGQTSAVLIHLQADLAKLYFSADPKKLCFRTVGETAQYIVNQLYGRQTECFCAYALDINLGLIRSCTLAEGQIDSVSVDLRKLASFALDAHAAFLILAHNHPNGSARPSLADIKLTAKIVAGMRPLGIEVCDHIITSGKDFYSFQQQRLFTAAEADSPALSAAQYSNLNRDEQ